MADSIKVFVLTRNNPEELRLCINGLKRRTILPINIIIVDNASDTIESQEYLNSLEKDESIIVYKNLKNLWVLGLNPAISKYLSEVEKFFVVTDSDIIVPLPTNGVCWLERLINEMNLNPVIGKLGISLDYGYLSTRPYFSATHKREVEFYKNPKIGNNHIAPVDTTLAIYRTDFFMIGKPRFYPGHGALGRPSYYCCRTSYSFKGKHIGWRFYTGSYMPQSEKRKKIICFSLMGAYIDPSYLNDTPFYFKFIYKVIRPCARGFWGLNVLRIQLAWFFKSSPLNLNKLQSELK